MTGSVIVAGGPRSGRSTLVNKMVLDAYTANKNGISVVSFRLQGANSVVGLAPNEVELFPDFVDAFVVSTTCRYMYADIFVFDSRYTVDAFKHVPIPSFFDGTLFFVVDATGDTTEELRVSAIENFLKVTKQKQISGFDKLMIAEVNDLGAENPFMVTEFLLTESF